MDESGSAPALEHTERAELRQVIQPVDDIERAVEFYRVAFGLPVRFVDGDRFAALEAGGAVLALVANHEDIAERSAAAFKVSDLEAFVSSLPKDATIIRGPLSGPHERRLVIADPWGNRIVVYASL
jgi:predicted enzyme related to lactoylglutathione lyase